MKKIREEYHNIEVPAELEEMYGKDSWGLQGHHSFPLTAAHWILTNASQIASSVAAGFLSPPPQPIKDREFIRNFSSIFRFLSAYLILFYSLMEFQ